jgi:hypothetical protein
MFKEQAYSTFDRPGLISVIRKTLRFSARTAPASSLAVILAWEGMEMTTTAYVGGCSASLFDITDMIKVLSDRPEPSRTL